MDQSAEQSTSSRPDPHANTAPPAGDPVPMPESGSRILGFGAHEHIARGVQDRLRLAGYRATAIAVSDDAASDARLTDALTDDTYDAVAIGGFISGQDPASPATAESAVWFNRVLNLVHIGAPTAKIILVRGPHNALTDIGRVLANPT
jgi:hypothetical protein